MGQFDLVITGFGGRCSQIAEEVVSKGVVGLRYVEGIPERHGSGNVISLNAYRETKERIQEGYHIAMIVISENDIGGYLKSIGEFHKNSGITLVFVTGVDNKDVSKNLGVRRLLKYADSVFPVATVKNQLDDVYGTVRTLIEAFTGKTLTGIDISDVAWIVRNAGIGITVQFTVPKDGDVVECLKESVYSQITRRQLLNAHGALISATGMNDLQYVMEILNEQSCFNISCVVNLLEDSGESMGSSREITVVFTGV